MAKLVKKKGAASNIFHVFIPDSASTTGDGKTGLAFNTAGLLCKYLTAGGVLSGLITLEDITILGTYAAPTSNAHMRFKEVDSAAPTKGIYEIHVHNDWMNLAGGNLLLFMAGATGMVPLRAEIQLDVNIESDSIAELTAIKGTGFDTNTDSLKQIKAVL